METAEQFPMPAENTQEKSQLYSQMSLRTRQEGLAFSKVQKNLGKPQSGKSRDTSLVGALDLDDSWF